jgi:hypothetical protein
MSTLTGNKISLTYKSLIKTSDNDVLTGALKELSDGLGNNSGVFLNTGGDLKSTGTLEFSNFKATAYAVTINKLVNEADGISNNDNDTSLPTSAAVKDYVDTHVTSQDLDFSDGTNPGAVDLDSQVFAIVGTSNEIETSASGQQLQIGLPNDVTISGTFFATEFQGALAGTINSGTTAVTQSAGDNSTKVATTAYVDTLDAASDLDFSDGSVSSAVNLNTQVFSIQGTSNEITTTASGQSLTIALDSAGVDLPDGSTAITQTAGDNSTKVATTAYVDVLDAASDLDIAGDTGTGDVNLNTQTLTLQGTTNQVITAVSGQTTTFSLPSTVHRDLQGNVTGDLTGNADTATAWQTARDLSISGEATGTLSSVDGTSNISGAVTLTNSAVTGKVLTGLPTPAASTVQASDSILEGIGKLQSQINGIANGLQFQGTWDAATNTPTLTSGGGEVDSGTTTGQTADKLIDSSQNFLTTVSVGDKVINQVDGQSALVTNVDSNTSLTLDADIMLSGEAYTIDASPFLVQGHYYVVSVGGTTSLNGNANWAIGDWVIAGADNIWSKLDHTQIDGQGTPGNLPVWNTATTLTDSIVSESGTALTVTGSLSTTLGASVTGDFAVNTDKFTVAAASGNTAFAGDLAINTNKFTVNATSGNTVVGGDVTLSSGYLNVTTDGSVAYGLLINSGDQSHSRIRINNTGSGGNAWSIMSGTSGVSNDGFAIRNETTTTTALQFTNTGDATFAGNVSLPDNSKAIFGTDGDLEIYHYSITDQAQIRINGELDIRANSLSLKNYAGGTYLRASSNGALRLYYAGVEKLQTTSTGVSVTGAINADSADISGNATFAGNVTVENDNDSVILIESVGTDATDDARLELKTTNGTFTIQNDRSIGTSGALTFAGNTSDNLVIDHDSGNVGINQTNPTSGKLEVQQSSTDAALWVQTGGTTSSYTIADFRTGTNLSALSIKGDGNSTFAGSVTSGDYRSPSGDTLYLTSGLDWRFRETGGTERMRIDSSGAVLIGNGVAAIDSATRLQVSGSDSGITSVWANADDIVFENNNNFGITLATPNTGAATIAFADPEATNEGYIQYVHGDDYMRFATSATERMRIDSSGNVGIGNTSPNSKLQVNGHIRAENSAFLAGREDASAPAHSFHDDSDTGMFNVNPNILGFSTAGSERMRITSGGVFALSPATGVFSFGSGDTSGFFNQPTDYMGKSVPAGANNVGIFRRMDDGSLFRFYRSTGIAGSITVSGSTTTYNTSSDYRLKEDLQDFSGLDKVSKIKMYDFKWKTDESRSYGVMAHELQEVLPDAVSGDKDAINEDESINPQGVDYSKIVPLLVKSIQELKAEVDKLKQECKCK